MRHPALGLRKFFRRKQDEPSVTQDERATGDPRQPIHEGRAEPRTERAGNDDARESQRNLSRICEMRGGRNDYLAWQRQEGAFHRHQQHDGRIAAGFERGQIPRDERLENLFQHGTVL